MPASTLQIVLQAQNMASGVLRQVGGDFKNFSDSATTQAGAMEKSVGSSMANMGKAVAIGAVAVGAALVGLGLAAFKLGEEFDKAYDKIAIGTGATGEALEGLKDSFKNVIQDVPTDFEKASTAIADLNTRTGLAGKSLEELAKTVLEFSRITKTDIVANVGLATRVFGDWSIATGDQTATLDKLFKASQLTGATVSDLMGKVVQFGAPLRAMNFSFEESVAMLGKWEKEGVNTELVLGSMRIAMGKFAKENVPMRKGLEDTFAQIQKLGPSAAATSLAMEVFGARAGPDMAAAILEGRFALGDLVEQINDSSGAVLSMGKATMSAGERWQMIMNKMKVAVEPVASAVFGFVGTILDNVGPAFDQFSQGAQSIIVPLQNAIKTGDFAPIIDNLKATGGLILDFIKAEAPKLATAFLAWAREAINWVVDALPGLWANLSEMLEGLLDWIIENGPSLAQKFLSEWLPAAIKWVAQVEIDIIPKLLGLILTIGGWIIGTGVPKLLEFAWKMGEAIIKGIVAGIGELAGALGEAIEDAIAAIEIDWGWIKISGKTGVTFDIRLPEIRPPPEMQYPNMGGMALGGSVAAMRPYLVGERGPELFMPRVAGTIIPSGQFAPAYAGGGVNIHLNIGGVTVTKEADENRLVAKIQTMLESGLAQAVGQGSRYPSGIVRMA